jgi:hypothetical protein
MRRRAREQLTITVILAAAVGAGLLASPYVHETTLGVPPAPLSSSGAAPDAPTAAGTPAAPAGSPAAAAAAIGALQQLQALPLSDGFVPGYRRDAFGPAWADMDHNGCDTRNDVLRRDLLDIATRPGTHGCVVLSGILHDPYTGRTIPFRRGETSSMAVQIDHRWPLGLAWQHGAASWTPELREQFANDPAGLAAVDGPANEQKSDSGPAAWMPPNTADACTYATTFVAVATKWRLSIGTADEHALDHTLTGCSTQGSNR